MLVVSHPCVALHEIEMFAQVRAARGGEQLGQITRVKNHQLNRCILFYTGQLQLIEMFRHHVKIDAVLAELCITIKVDVVAELVIPFLFQ